MLVDLFKARFDPDGRRGRGRAHGRAGAGDRGRARERREPVRGPRAAPVPGARAAPRRAPTSGAATPPGKRRSFLSFKFDPAKVPGLPEPKPMFEIFVYSTRFEGVHLRGGKRRARRPALVGPARGLPHRGAGARQGADGEEHRHRAGRLQGRLRAEARAARRRSRRVHEGRRRVLPGLSARPARHHRQPRRRQDRAAAAGASGTTPTTRISSSPRTRAPRRSPTTRTASARNTASGWATRSPRAARSATTTRRWASRRAARGNRSSATSARWASIRRRPTSPWPASATCRATCSATACCCRATSGWWRRSTTATSFSTRIPDAATSFAERERMFKLPRSTWADYDTKLISKGGGVHPRSAKSIADHARGEGGARRSTPMR